MVKRIKYVLCFTAHLCCSKTHMQNVHHGRWIAAQTERFQYIILRKPDRVSSHNVTEKPEKLSAVLPVSKGELQVLTATVRHYVNCAFITSLNIFKMVSICLQARFTSRQDHQKFLTQQYLGKVWNDSFCRALVADTNFVLRHVLRPYCPSPNVLLCPKIIPYYGTLLLKLLLLRYMKAKKLSARFTASLIVK